MVALDISHIAGIDCLRRLPLVANRALEYGDRRRINHCRDDCSATSRNIRSSILPRKNGDRERSIALYKQVEESSDAGMARAAKYNRANGYLAKAMELPSDDNQNLSLPLAELAKDNYRSLLRIEPGYWDAKYNLERALRLVPDPDDSEDAELPPPQQSERAPTTMRGFTLGLP